VNVFCAHASVSCTAASAPAPRPGASAIVPDVLTSARAEPFMIMLGMTMVPITVSTVAPAIQRRRLSRLMISAARPARRRSRRRRAGMA
jgi:hypothetical protein